MKTIKRKDFIEMVYKDSQSKIFNDLSKTLQKASVSDLHNFLNNDGDLSNRFVSNINKMIMSFTNIVYTATESKLKELLSQANENDDVSVRIFDGVIVDCSYIPKRTKTNNFNGEIVVYPPYLKPKFNVSRNYIKTLNRIT